MPHPRQTIREAIKAILDGVPSFAGRVSTTRTRPTQTEELPCVIIYALSEQNEDFSVGADLFRTLSVGIEARAANTTDIDDVLDAMCLQIEVALASDRSLRDTADNSTLSATTIGLDGEGEARQGIATLSYTITYFTDPTIG